MPTVAKSFSFKDGEGKDAFILDGEEFPWFIGEDFGIEEIGDGLALLNVSILVDTKKHVTK